MSYVALATERFEQMADFYGERMGFRAMDAWDRTNGRGVVFDAFGLRLEILDATREKGLKLGNPEERVHLVIEVKDVDAFHAGLSGQPPPPADTSWGARLFRLRDPDGIPVTVLQRIG